MAALLAKAEMGMLSIARRPHPGHHYHIRKPPVSFGAFPVVYKKLALDFAHSSPLRVVMILSEEDRAELPRELFALAGRRLEYGIGKAMEGEGRNAAHGRRAQLSARLHEVGQDLKVIADAIAVLAEERAR
jgi:hypothetical protein